MDFSEVKLRDCAIPRTEITALPEEGTTLIDLRNTFTNTGYSKILIYRESIDNIIGYFHSNDLFKNPENWKNQIRPLPIVPETMAANKLMDIFMQEKKSIAVVVDEYGGTAGIISLEDVLEQIFGEIEDEHDVQELVEKSIADGEWLFSARHEVEYLNENYDLGIPESEEYDTLAGYIIAEYGGLPTEGEEFDTEDYRITIVKRELSRLELVRVRRRG